MKDVYQALDALSSDQLELFDVMLDDIEIGLKQLPLPRVAEDVMVPLSSAQRRFWFIYQMDPASSAYNESFIVRLKGELDLTILEKSLQQVVQRHEVLRTACLEGEDELYQKLLPSTLFSMVVDDLKAISSEAQERQLLETVNAEISTPFDLTNDINLRVLVIQLAEDEHVFIMTTNHFAMDGLSVRLLVNEISTTYNAHKTDGSNPVGDGAGDNFIAQYRDFALWEKYWLASNEVNNQLEYWKAYLQDANTVLDLPTDHPRPRVMSFKGRTHRFLLPKTLSQQLKILSGTLGSTLFMSLLSAFQCLLYRYTNQEDILTGMSPTVRSRPELDSMFGDFSNNLVMRTEFSSDSTFRDIVEHVAESTVDCFSHQDLPFESILEKIPHHRALNHTSMFQVMFMLHNETLCDNFPLSGVEVSEYQFERGTAHFDLDLMLSDSADGISGALAYNADIFEAHTIERLVKLFEVLLMRVVEQPDAKLATLSLLDDEQRSLIINEWNNTNVVFPAESKLHELFEAQVERFPDKSACVFEDKHLSYAELNKRANQLAHYLIKAGVEPGQLIGICVERSLDMMVGLLGILKAGGAYVPLDPAYPTERLAYMLSDSQAPLVVIQAALKERLTGYAGRTVFIDSDWSKIAAEDDRNPLKQGQSDDLAYVIYTSGSTGKPKGVTLPHRAVVNFLCAMRRAPGLTEVDRLLAVTTISFDIAVLELYLPLTTGATTVIASRDAASDGTRLLALIASENITVMQATPITWRLLLESDWQGTSGLKVLCGGEAMPRELASQLVEKCDELWNLYGPTETTVWSMRYQVKRDADEATVLIGRPIENTQIYLLDEHLLPVPVGVPGEIYIGGAGLARDYLNRPELTAERFVPNPFDENSRLYRTGDLAFYHDDGNVEYMRRIDNQVKVRGFRIELGEIESALSEHDAIERAVVNVWENRPGDHRLVAYLIYKRGEGATVTEIRTHLRALLPEYMVPQHIVEMDGFPVTPNGKLDRKRLPAPFGDSYENDEYVSPETGTEKYLATVWCEALGIERVSVHDNFFDLGGHSLLSMKVIERIRKETAVVISPRVLLMESLGAIAATHSLPDVDSKPDIQDTGGQQQRSVDSSANVERKAAASPGFFNKIKNRLLNK